MSTIMKANLYFCVALLFSLLAASNGLAGTVGYDDPLKDAPVWVFNPAKGATRNEVAAVGAVRIGKEGNTHARKQAFSRAMDELSMAMVVKITSHFKHSVDVSTGSSSYQQVLKGHLDDENRKRMSKIVKEKDFWISPDDEIFVLAVADKGRLGAIAKSNNFKWDEYIKSYKSYKAENNESVDHALQIKNNGEMAYYIMDSSTIKIADTDSGGNNDQNKIQGEVFPKWVLDGTRVRDGKLRVIGSATIKNREIWLAILEARAFSRNDIAMFISTKVQNKEDKDTKASNTTTNQTIFSSSQRDLWISPDGELFILMEADAQANKDLKAAILSFQQGSESDSGFLKNISPRGAFGNDK